MRYSDSTMTVKTAKEVIGRQADLRLDGLTVLVEILDARFVFGRDDARVRPVSGTGEKWVSMESLVVKEAK